MRRQLAKESNHIAPQAFWGAFLRNAARCSTAAVCFYTTTVLAALAPAQPETVAGPAEVVEEITVRGQRPSVLRKLMNDFVLEIGDPAAANRGYARWRDRVCVGVFNLPDRTAAQYLVDKITLFALELGLKTGSPGCRPNVNIVFSPDARALATAMVDGNPTMFRPYGGTGGTNQGMEALERFKTSDAPVRWWQITMIVDELGLPAFVLPEFEGTIDNQNLPTYRGMASRIKTPLSDVIWGELVIVDAGKLEKTTWPQLAAYLAMVSLAQVDPDGRPTNYDSILNLFSARTPPNGLTEMDRVYLKGLYAMDTQVFPHTQRGMLANHMVRELRALDDGD